MNYSMKNSQQSLMNLIHPQINSQYIPNNNQNLKNLLKNFKIQNIISHNNNYYISKFKTTKNSPERLILEKTVNAKKNNENKIMNKKVNKLIRDKIIFDNQKKTDKIMEELLKNKITKNKQKMNDKANDIKNNRMKGKIYKKINSNTNNNTMNDNLNNMSHILSKKTPQDLIHIGLLKKKALIIY